METALSSEAEVGAAPNSAAERVAECWAQFVRADKDRHTVGIALGHAVIELRREVAESGDGEFMARLKQLGVSYEKARYWMAKVEGKPTDRHKPESAKAGRPGLADWDAAESRLARLKDDIFMLKQAQPVGAGRLGETLASLAELLGYELKAKGGSNEDLLQRVRPERGCVAEGPDGGRADSAGGGR